MVTWDEVKRWLASVGVALLIAAIALGGWSLLFGGDDPKPSGEPFTAAPRSSSAPPAAPTQPTAAPEPTAAPTYINAAPGEAPPVRPPDELSDAGLEAFVRYFMQTVDWAEASMDPTLLYQASSADCGLCLSVVKSVNNNVAAGRRYEGGRYTLVRLALNPDLSPDGTRRNVEIWLDGSEFTIFEADGSVMRRDPPESNHEYSLDARFSGGRWAVTSMLLVERQ